ncbi:MAG: tetratricopeptide repeat protein [Burkholderiales bacterium]|nr:tetratricopeptide repeat protein [Burkholderiales bacterium]
MKPQNQTERLFREAFAAHQAGKLNEARELYRQVLRKMPSHMETLYLLGTACSQQKRYEEAEKHLRKALGLKPDHPEALNNLGLTLRGLNKIQEAVDCYRRALALSPDYADAHSNLGGALEFMGELDEAESHLRRALQLNPNHADAHYNLGLVLKEKDRFEEASQYFLRGLELKPDFPGAYCDLGVIYKLWGRNEEALSCLLRALALDADFYSAQSNLGAVLEEMGRLDEALAAYKRAIELNPDEIIAGWNLAFLYLKQGILDRGWEAHEMRFQMGMAAKRFSFPDWDGSSLEGKKILIYAEQGLGDEILFASCFPDVISMAGHCVIECAPRLASIFSRSFPSSTVVGSSRDQTNWLAAEQDIDVAIPAGSLPRFLRTTLESFPGKPGYLVADPQRVEYWRSRTAMLGPGLKVGICWRSGFLKGERHKYYSELSQWGNIFKIPGVHFVNLQYDECSGELSEAEEQFGIDITVFQDLDLRNDIDDSAALIAGLDLVITAATAVCEIAGALGLETYRLNAFGKQWEYLGTDEMPWHPSVKLFCQPAPGDWDTPLALISEALKEKIEGHASIVEYASLPSNVEIAVDGSLDELYTYVLKEQQGLFDSEYGFVLGLAKGGMNMVDVGAGIGAYSIPMAKRGGKLLALARSATEMNLLLKSRKKNALEKQVDFSIPGDFPSLDSEMDRYGLENVSFVRISAEFSLPALIGHGARFFSVNSPLVMFSIKPEQAIDLAMAWQFKSSGFDLYRFIPGLDLLVPFSSPDELDVFSLNLFACKPDRAGILEKDGMLIRQTHALESFPGIDLPYWQNYLGAAPYVSKMLAGWLSAPEQKGWEVYWMALNLFVLSRSANRSMTERHASLQAAAGVMTTLVNEAANLPRLLSLCRILIELGRREVAVNLLNHICALLDSGQEMALDEPFLALSIEHEKSEPGNSLAQWLAAMVLEERERLRAFSSFFTEEESLPVLEELHASGFLSEAMAGRITLIKTRFGNPQ